MHDSRFDTNVILCGQGGSGKTYEVFNSKTLLKPLYVVPSHVLGRHFADEYKCKYTTIHKLAGSGCQSFASEKGHSPAIVMIDEITMISEDMIFEAIKRNPSTRFILAGDVDEEKWYQCRSGKGDEYNEIITKKEIQNDKKMYDEYVKEYEELFVDEDVRNQFTSKVCLGDLYKWDRYRHGKIFQMNDTLNFNYIYFNIDRRSKDDELKEMKIFVRNCMDEVFTDGGVEDAYEITRMLKSEYHTISFKNAVKEFKNGDIFIAGTHATNQILLDNNVSSGYITTEKELIFDVDNIPEKSTKRGSFTTHSFQGFTIKDKKVFIVLDLFEYAMLYTSISRCTNFNQIVLVDKPDNKTYTETKNKLKAVKDEKEAIEMKKKTEKEEKKKIREEKKAEKEEKKKIMEEKKKIREEKKAEKEEKKKIKEEKKNKNK
jgi:hypothetical protein